MKKNLLQLVVLLFLSVSFSCSNGENAIDFNLKLNKLDPVISSPDVLDEPYGICAQIARKDIDYPYIDEILDIMDEMNITWVRSSMDWSLISTEPGNVDYSYLDQVFSHLKTHPQIHLLPVFNFNGSYQHAQNPTLQIKEYYQDWKEYIDGVASHYKDYCPAWEGLNNWETWVSRGEFEYRDILKYQSEIYNTVKKYNPNAKILMGAMKISDIDLSKLTSLSAQKYYDISNLRNYSDSDGETSFLNATKQLVDIYNQGNFERPLWVTEFGYSTAKGKVSEEEQAYYIPRSFIVGFSQGVSRMFLNTLRSTEGFSQEYQNDNHMGILHKDFTPKPAYHSVRNLIKMLPSGSTRPVLYNFSTIYIASWTHPQKGKIFAIWNAGDTKKINLNYQGTPHCYSYMDIEKEMKIDDYGNFEIGPGIIYIEGVTALALK